MKEFRLLNVQDLDKSPMFQALLPTHEAHILPTILMLVRALEREGVSCRKSFLNWKAVRAAAKLASSVGLHRLPLFQSAEPVFVHLNHAWSHAFYPYVLRHALVTYSFDLWPDTWDNWQKVFEQNRPRIAFISAKTPMAEMQRRLPGIDFRWLPEAVDPAGFDPALPLAHRPIDVLEVGRPYMDFHERIKSCLEDAQVCHQYPVAGKIAPIPYEEVALSYGRSKVMVVFPRAVSHPDQARGVETTTFRYFECMASKTLMIGHCPAELIEIMGYNPVIEANMDDPAKQILSNILPRIADYQSLVDRNHETLCSTWTVNHQAKVIHSALNEVVSRPR